MIKKLKKRVRLLIQIPLFLLITLISAAFLYLNYTGIMSSATAAKTASAWAYPLCRRWRSITTEASASNAKTGSHRLPLC